MLEVILKDRFINPGMQSSFGKPFLGRTSLKLLERWFYQAFNHFTTIDNKCTIKISKKINQLIKSW